MQITYDKESDCKYIAFQKRKRGIVARTEPLATWLLVDYTKDGSIYGVEILDASRHSGALITIGNTVEFVEQAVTTLGSKFQRIEARTPRIDASFVPA